MTALRKRVIAALILCAAAGVIGYSLGVATVPPAGAPHIAASTVTAPSPGSLRIIYSLDQKQNDKEIIALIDGAKTHIYFAIYTFTLTDIAEALARAKARGVDVRGVVDSGQAVEKFSAPVMQILNAANIPIVVERHATGNGIMHIKMIVTDRAYALGSYNWTASATNINDEILEIGTDPATRKIYEDILLKLLHAYRGNTAAQAAVSIGTINYTEAPQHIGEIASVRGVLVDTYTSKTSTVFLDFCQSYKNCPFSGVIFSSDAKKFPDLETYVGKTITLTGKISSYQGKAEIVLNTPSQISRP
ncbi:hypothetical protein COU19_02800 [Candidatus Kaiserbacteria bacterium CG10_big_fil_rev_8_21_14_0_10_56_12]|uniref:phospholipase D n=1 Tax=Candidatus Kaiserbacteria bacterium CG10_big_fil_rev_8_21_14_0_10_56_12 TaxID=1974611 RepID=A0A2H0U9N5_9BACT|nr:MAG: hypothetical protein COU19_02800 [Candidatus Kaiserbacteria bacterium CG10_big_fil_rev_8_21_14_0_10_56_12]